MTTLSFFAPAGQQQVEHWWQILTIKTIRDRHQSQYNPGPYRCKLSLSDASESQHLKNRFTDPLLMETSVSRTDQPRL